MRFTRRLAGTVAGDGVVGTDWELRGSRLTARTGSLNPPLPNGERQQPSRRAYTTWGTIPGGLGARQQAPRENASGCGRSHFRSGIVVEDRCRPSGSHHLDSFRTASRPISLPPTTPIDRRAIAIANAARRLVKLRDHWLNPPEWVEWVDEPAPGCPKRPVPRNEYAAKALKFRTLTALYNTRPR